MFKMEHVNNVQLDAVHAQMKILVHNVLSDIQLVEVLVKNVMMLIVKYVQIL